jgi:hypothetical protein
MNSTLNILKMSLKQMKMLDLIIYFEVYNLKRDLTIVYVDSKNNITYSLDIFEMKSIKSLISKYCH